MPGKGRRSMQAEEELNLIPIMNLVSILIPFLLMAAQFVHLAVIDSTLPAIGPPQEVEEEEKPDKPPLQLSILITDKGLTVAGDNGIVSGSDEEGAEPLPEGEEKPPTVPCRGGLCSSPDSYDYEELTRLLGDLGEGARVHGAHPADGPPRRRAGARRSTGPSPMVVRQTTTTVARPLRRDTRRQ